MRLTTIALGGVTALDFPLTANADPQGWYLGYVLNPPVGPQSGKIDFGDLLVVTGPGVRGLQNRRAVIDTGS